VPRVEGGEESGIKTVEVPWARPGSGFTLMMEAMMVLFTRNGMTVAQAGRTLGEHAQRVWRVLFHHVEQAHEEMDLSAVGQLTVDETSIRRGHEYVTVVCEPARSACGPRAAVATRVLYVTEGKDASTIARARQFLEQRQVPAEQIREIYADMSPAFRKGIEEQFPKARLVFDYFHVIGLVSGAVDKIRRWESREFPELLKGTRYLWLKNEENLKPEQIEQRQRLKGSKLKTAKAHGQLAAFQDLLKARCPQDAIAGLKWWYTWVMRSRLPEMKKVVASIRKHWDGIVAYLETRLTNGPAEAVNGLIQTAKRKSRGFRSSDYFRVMIYLIGSKLNFNHLPSPVPFNPLRSS
jgi:transposase